MTQHTDSSFELYQTIRQCTLCSEHLPLGPKPIVSFTPKSKIILVSQAPGRVAHQKDKAWDDAGGKMLKSWLDVTDEQFYNPDSFAIVPIGFCYPGKAKMGDLPPRPECAPTWHDEVFAELQDIKMIILIGKYAQDYYLKDKQTLTHRVRNFLEYSKYVPLPHPSPVNRFWRAKNPWFEEDILPILKYKVKKVLQP